MTGVKHDGNKRRFSLLPLGAVNEVVDVLEYGAKKYAENDWVLVENGRTRYFDAALRHLIAWRMGESFDEESGLKHLAHAACCLLFLIFLDTPKKETP